MGNLKHSIAALMAVVMVGSLAVTQATDIQPARANKLADENGQETPETVSAENITEFTWNLDIKTAESFEPVINREDLVFKPFTAYVVSKDGAAVWSAPEGEIIGSLSCAEQTTVIDADEKWYTVAYLDQEAFVLKSLLTEDYAAAKQVLLDNYMFETGRAAANGNSLNIRSGASTDGTQIIDQVEDGDMIVVLERENDGWVKVYYGENYQTGYVKAEFIAVDGMASRDEVYAARSEKLDAMAETAQVVSGGKATDILYMPNSEAAVIGTLTDGAQCSVLEKGSKWTKIVFGDQKSIGYVKSEVILTDAEKAEREAAKEREAERKAEQEQAAAKAQQTKKTVTEKTALAKNAVVSQTTQSTGSGNGQAIVNEAKKYIGVRYVYGGTSPAGFDCSGLVQYVCRKVGIAVNRSSSSQYSNGTAVSRSELQPGDLVFFSKGGGISHVAIYAGGGQLIHSPRPGKSVCYISLNDMTSYSKYVGARRVA